MPDRVIFCQTSSYSVLNILNFSIGHLDWQNFDFCQTFEIFISKTDKTGTFQEHWTVRTDDGRTDSLYLTDRACCTDSETWSYFTPTFVLLHMHIEDRRRDGRTDQLVSKTQTWRKTLRFCFRSSFVEFRSVVAENKSRMSQPIRGQGGHLSFLVGPKNTNFADDVEFLHPVKFRWILFGRLEKKSKMSQPIRG